MTYKKRFFVLLTLLILFTVNTVSYADSNSDKKTLIVYENEKSFAYNENKVNHLKELLYVFNKDVSKVSVNDYKKGYMEKFDYVFVINIRNDIKNTDFLNDLTNFKNKIYWIGDKIENLLNYSNKYSITYNSKNNNITKLNYKNKELAANGANSYNIINPSSSTNVISSMTDGYNTYPFILNDKNLYYISKWDLKNSYIFDDTLNDFYERKKFGKNEIFVRIEDVHPFRDTKKLREIADYLYKENVPFMIALIPTYVDSKTGKINTLDSKDDFVETIKYMQKKGGSVILHGYTHQIGHKEVSGEGYEFWDIKNDKPVKEDMYTYVKNRFLSGLRLCVENGIYPLAFEAPHYAMNIDGYKEAKKYFSTYVGQYQNNNDNFVTSTFPYTIKNSDTFETFIPENLGFIDDKNMFAVDEIKEKFEKLEMVRGYRGGFFYHPYLDIKYLKESIQYLKNNNVNFLDLKSKENYVKIDDISIESKDGKINYTYDKSKSASDNKQELEFKNNMKSINNAVIIFVSTILVLFLIIFIIFRIMNKRKFTRR